jgi:iron(II)-dependent oxidoreductase
MTAPETLASWVRDARLRTVSLLANLSDEQLAGSHLPILSPFLWIVGHLAWYQEKWVLRRGRQPSLRPDADALYDPNSVTHSQRWKLALPTRADTLAYADEVEQRVLQRVEQGLDADDSYFVLLSVFHEDVHGEVLIAARQTLGYAAPRLSSAVPDAAGPLPGDVAIPGGTFELGATPGVPFVFDNEKWAHAVEVKPFTIARAPVTQAEFQSFVDRGGYHRPQLWCDDGWRWRQAVDATQPVYWKRNIGGGWLRRDFDQWLPLEPHRPIHHVNWYEAEAYCRWVQRRLPTEAEWEVAAAAVPDGAGGLGPRKRLLPWGDQAPSPASANLDAALLGCTDAAALPAGDSAFGCRQMIGNVWEWTASDFLPYPGFAPDPCQDRSEPWFGSHKVLRGGCWMTRARLLRNTWRHYLTPDRRDVCAGFRTCAQ